MTTPLDNKPVDVFGHGLLYTRLLAKFRRRTTRRFVGDRPQTK